MKLKGSHRSDLDKSGQVFGAMVGIEDFILRVIDREGEGMREKVQGIEA